MNKIRKQTKLWKKRDSTKIRVCDMSDNHLNNAIKMFFRSYKAMLYKKYNQLIAYISGDPPDGAYWAAEGEIGQLEGILWGTQDYDGPDINEAAERDLPMLRCMLLEQLRRKNINKNTWDNFVNRLRKRKR